MLAAELPEELRKQLLWERMSRQRILGGAAVLNRSSSSPKLASQGDVTPPQQPSSHALVRKTSGPPAPTTPNQAPPAPGPPLKRSTGVLGSNGLRPLTAANGNSSSTSALAQQGQQQRTLPPAAGLKRSSSKVTVHAYGDGIVGRGMGGVAPKRRKEEDETSSEEDSDADEEEDIGILRRRNTHDGAISSIVADNGWDSDYHGHGF